MYSPLVHGGSRTMNKSSNKRGAPVKGQRSKLAQSAKIPKSIRPRKTSRGGGNNERSVEAPAALGSVRGARRAEITTASNSGDLRIRVKSCEYVADITGSVNFAVQQFNVNPGLALLFPWVSQLANLYESYKCHGLRFLFRTESPTSQAGKVMLMVDWDANDSAPLSKTAMMQERTKADGPTWSNFDLRCDPQDLLKFGTQRYVRQGLNPAGSDIKTYDVGVLNVATQGCTNTPVVGEIWVEYDIEFMTPNTAPVPNSVNIAGGGSISSAAVLGTAPVITGTLPVSVNSTGEIVTFSAAGQYLVELYVQGTLSALVWTASAGSNLKQTIVNAGNALANGTQSVQSFLFEANTAGATITFSSPTGTVTASNLRIAQYAYANA
jgi:hypothetical protein